MMHRPSGTAWNLRFQESEAPGQGLQARVVNVIREQTNRVIGQITDTGDGNGWKPCKNLRARWDGDAYGPALLLRGSQDLQSARVQCAHRENERDHRLAAAEAEARAKAPPVARQSRASPARALAAAEARRRGDAPDGRHKKRPAED